MQIKDLSSEELVCNVKYALCELMYMNLTDYAQTYIIYSQESLDENLLRNMKMMLWFMLP